MCLESFTTKVWSTPCGALKAAKIIKFLKMILRIIKSVISRFLFVLYSIIAVWRVTQALHNDLFWLLLLTLCPLALETLNAIFIRKGKEMKWITPSVLFYLLCGVPCIWLLEIKLLDDRLGKNTTTSNSNSSNLLSSVITIQASDKTWTLALEQTLILVLVLAKWIAPKGAMSLDELSQLLLVQIAAGADILELLEAFQEDKVAQNSEIVYLIMVVWSWSLLQFALVLTASKTLPPLDEDYDEVIIGGVKVSTLKRDEKHVSKHKDGDSTLNYEDKENGDEKTVGETNGSNNSSYVNESETNIERWKCIDVITDESTEASTEASIESKASKQISNGGSETVEESEKPKKKDSTKTEESSSKPSEKKEDDIEVVDETAIVPTTLDRNMIHDRLRADEELDALLKGRRCFECFCCYNEIWGMLMSILFQDGPFFILRMVMLFHYEVVTHMSIFFTCKNILVIVLLLNRIRVVVRQERKPWKRYMSEVVKMRRREKDDNRRKLGLPPKTKDHNAGSAEEGMRKRKTAFEMESGKRSATPILPKPRWVIWRA